VTVTTLYGPVRVKRGWEGDRLAILAPEYEDCRRLALAAGVAVHIVYDEAQRTAQLLPQTPLHAKADVKLERNGTNEGHETGE
jgi:uncharacterized protein (DUF111 family)